MSRLLRLGAGETIAGRVTRRLAPSLPESLASGLADGVIVVSGTNGKTTTSAMIEAIARAHGIACVTNRSGSNMPAGIAGALLFSGGARLGVFEVDEMALPAVIRMLQPRVVVLTNVFRDQLDRFGEPETVAGLFATASALLGARARIVLNGDDPNLAGVPWPREATFYGVRLPSGDDPHGGGEPELCPACGGALVAETRTFAHLGVFRCSRCEWRSPPPDLVGRIVERDGLASIGLEVGGTTFTVAAGGAYNAYNAVAAIAAADALGFDRDKTIGALSRFRPRFGRLERMRVGDCSVLLALAKNPAGANAILSELGSGGSGAIVIAVNDLAADGRDVSWIWDVEFELLAGLSVPVIAAGTRADEVALRLRYAGIPVALSESSPAAAVKAAARLAGGSDVSMLATYTAMLDLRRSVLGRTKAVVDAPDG
jgi:UDP-N-acetylmuramyl tripeptide synthase